MIGPRFFWVCFAALMGVYGIGLFATLMENDSAQFAVMAMRMYQENDWLSLWKGPEEYLDKPHLHYWLAALSYTVFGLHDWAYRIPALLATLLGTYSTYGLATLFYNRNSGRLAALIFLSAQTIVLSVIDVRTDAVLTGFTAFALWQLARYLTGGSLWGLMLGALGAGLAFSTKGQIALLVIALPLLCQLLARGGWKRLADPRLLLGLAVFALAIAPMLYAYYHQFDLHPDKVIRGRDHRSGILFIFWEQSFERLSGEGVGKNSSDYFFFFHTFLWVFLPWTLIGLAAYGTRLREGWSALRARSPLPGEWVTAGGITLIFVIISFAQFKLPHYLNILIPLFAVLSGGFLDARHREGRQNWLGWVARLQAGILGIVWLALALIFFWVFPLPLAGAVAGMVALAALAVLLWTRFQDPLQRLVGISILASVMLNAGMNGYFYPRLLEYQAGSELAGQIKTAALPISEIYKVTNEHTWALDFYFGKPAVFLEPEKLQRPIEAWIYVDEKQREKLASQGLHWDAELVADQFRISRLQARFLNPATRQKVVGKRYLLHITPQ